MIDAGSHSWWGRTSRRILIAPMAAMAQASGPCSRSRALALGLLAAGYEPAFCAARDVNFRSLRGVRELFAPVPSPVALPRVVGRILVPLARSRGVLQRRRIRSFEEVLHLVGAIGGRFFASDVEAVRSAIREFGPDVVYGELRPAALVAARLEGVPAATGYSYTANPAFASSPQFASGVRQYLRRHGLPDVESVLDIFDWAAVKIVASSQELEPLDDPKVVFTGPLSIPYPAYHRKARDPVASPKGADRDAVVVSLGQGSIGYRRQTEVVTESFARSPYQVYLANHHARSFGYGNVHVARSFDLDELLPRAAASINRGERTSVHAALMAGVPQIIFPGNLFERRYNAESAAKLGLGLFFDDSQFDPLTLRRAVEAIRADRDVDARVSALRSRMAALGGLDRAIEAIAALGAGASC